MLVANFGGAGPSESNFKLNQKSFVNCTRDSSVQNPLGTSKSGFSSKLLWVQFKTSTEGCLELNARREVKLRDCTAVFKFMSEKLQNERPRHRRKNTNIDVDICTDSNVGGHRISLVTP